MKDSLWSIDLFRCESISLRTHWVMVIKEIKTLSYIPLSHSFVERLIRSIRHELLDQTLFWYEDDLQRKLDQYQHYFNLNRSHKALNAETPYQKAQPSTANIISIKSYKWKLHCIINENYK